MCGIVGIVAQNSRVDPEMLERATDSLAHRGPDDAGTVIVREGDSARFEVGLGNRRLAVLDLSPLGHQPMWDAETGNWIVYNGEIYNFREIRGELEREGVRFASHSDTEVLLKAYGRWGEAALLKLRGMFAFAIWDAQRHRLFLARDPMGIKPIYYGSFGEVFLFASELRVLLDTGLVPRRLDRAGLLNYLNFGSLCDPITLIQGIFCLRPGHFLTWQQGTVRETGYWDPLEHARHSESNHLSATAMQRKGLEEEVYATIEQCVSMQTVSDVAVGVFLSGGIDSSSLVGILSRRGFRVSTFSLVFPEAGYSEADYSRIVAKKFATDHHEILVSQEEALKAIPNALDAMDQPTIDGFNTYLVSRETRAAGIKVALSGLGGDELFAGYSSFKTVPQMERFSQYWGCVPVFLRQALASAFFAFASDTDQSRKLSAMVVSNSRLVHPYFLTRMLFTPQQIDSLLQSCDPQIIERANAAFAEEWRKTTDLDPINRVSYLESRCYMLNTLLRDSDTMSMANGLEIRVPLIDHQLAEQLLALPGAWKMDPHTPKNLLVRALHGALPDEIVHRPKRGFVLPFEHWLRAPLRAEVESTLRTIARGSLAEVLNSEKVGKIWEDFLAGQTSWSRPWSLYVLHRWCELHNVTV
jgi:asparagine synthase (glutamine-hydrolysing)